MDFNQQFPKNDPIWKYSNPKIVQEKAYSLYGDDAVIFRSRTKNKKYAIINPHGKIVNFGEMGYEDFTKHDDAVRRMSYLRRSTNIKGNWRDNFYSKNWLAINLLW